jgi:hypothetical protein
MLPTVNVAEPLATRTLLLVATPSQLFTTTFASRAVRGNHVSSRAAATRPNDRSAHRANRQPAIYHDGASGILHIWRRSELHGLSSARTVHRASLRQHITADAATVLPLPCTMLLRPPELLEISTASPLVALTSPPSPLPDTAPPDADALDPVGTTHTDCAAVRA